MSLHLQGGVVQNSKSINNVGAYVRVNVLGLILSNARSVPSPVGEVTYNLVVPRGSIGRNLNSLRCREGSTLCSGGGGGYWSGLNNNVRILAKANGPILGTTRSLWDTRVNKCHILS